VVEDRRKSRVKSVLTGEEEESVGDGLFDCVFIEDSL
jgi:hypothetical protein